jgi:predicted DNA-binding transcriptional regulator
MDNRIEIMKAWVEAAQSNKPGDKAMLAILWDLENRLTALEQEMKNEASSHQRYARFIAADSKV